MLRISGHDSTQVDEGTHGRKRLLDRLKRGQAVALASIEDRAHRGQQVTSPVGAKPVRDLPQDRAHAHGLLARVLRGGRIGTAHASDPRADLRGGAPGASPRDAGVRGFFAYPPKRYIPEWLMCS
jgi:hypothetical protein